MTPKSGTLEVVSRGDRPTISKLRAQAGAPQRKVRYCLLVMGARETSTLVSLPDAGEVVLGRAEDCTVRIDDGLLSRRHAVLRIGDGFEIVDLGSLNGTRLGDRTLEPNVPVEVGVGDVISLGHATAVIQIAATGARPRRVWSHGYFEARLEDECARADGGGSPFAVLRVRIQGTAPPNIEEQLAQVLRPTDVMATYADAEYELLLTETRPDLAGAIATEIRTRLVSEGAAPEIGIACYPRDGRTPESLVERSGKSPDARRADDAEETGFVQTGALERMQPLLTKVAAGTISVLLLGETGVGKEVHARALHERSPRASKPFLCLNCAAFSETLLESELFGHEKGAFSGAVAAKQGLLESANGGTVFLDEIGEMPPSLQAKMLRVLEQREVLRVGALRPKPIDVRFIAATNRDLEDEIQKGRFRQDLFFRLNGFTMIIPPLRQRVDEIEPLARAFIAHAAAQLGRKRAPKIAADALDLLKRYEWPGNIRELRNVMERAVLLCTGDVITVDHLPREKMGPIVHSWSSGNPTQRGRPGFVAASSRERSAESTMEITVPGFTRPVPPSQADDPERARVIAALERCAGNQTQAAKLLGISRQTLVARLEQFSLPRPRKRV